MPPEFLKTALIEGLRDGQVVFRRALETGCTRQTRAALPSDTLCDQVRLKGFATYGADRITLFRVRLYGV